MLPKNTSAWRVEAIGGVSRRLHWSATRIAKLLADERGYIDPGTGSMLFTVLIGLVSAGVYAMRGLVAKARFVISGGRASANEEDNNFNLVVFSEGKRYWNIFEPICDEMEARGVDASFLTASPDDPALNKGYEHVKCEFIGEGNRAFARLNSIKADILLATTPGLDVFQWKRSRDVGYYVHVVHMMTDVTIYRMFALDYFDAVFVSGAYQEKEIRAIEQVRNLPAKDVQVVGLTYVDALWHRLNEAPEIAEHKITILLAPTWGSSSIFSVYKDAVLKALLQTGYNVIVRPHPQSFVSEKELIESLMQQYPDSDCIEWNTDADNFDVLSRADIMISDFSGVIFDFALVFDKPVMYTEPVFDSAPYDACWLEDEPWVFSTLPKIGKQLSKDDLLNIKSAIDECLSGEQYHKGRAAAREECWGNRGNSARAIVDLLVSKRSEFDDAD